MTFVSPVQAQGAQVEHGDAGRCFLQERNQFAQEQTECAVGEGPLHRQELQANTHTHTQSMYRLAQPSSVCYQQDILVSIIRATPLLCTHDAFLLL